MRDVARGWRKCGPTPHASRATSGQTSREWLARFDPGRAEGPAQTKLARSASEVWRREWESLSLKLVSHAAAVARPPTLDPRGWLRSADPPHSYRSSANGARLAGRRARGTRVIWPCSLRQHRFATTRDPPRRERCLVQASRAQSRVRNLVVVHRARCPSTAERRRSTKPWR